MTPRSSSTGASNVYEMKSSCLHNTAKSITHILGKINYFIGANFNHFSYLLVFVIKLAHISKR